MGGDGPELEITIKIRMKIKIKTEARILLGTRGRLNRWRKVTIVLEGYV